jgi:hypothetical protein
MLAKRFAEYILKSRLRAIIMAVLFSVLPYLGWISGIVVALVTLRKGAAEGFNVLIWSLLPAIVGLFVSFVHPNLSWFPFAMTIFYSGFLAWLGAVLLLRFNWSVLLQMIALFGIIGVALMHAFIPDVAAWWMKTMSTYMKEIEQGMKISTVDTTRLQGFIKQYSLVATGFQIMLYSVTGIAEVFLARGLESSMFNPGQLMKEATKIRLSLISSFIFFAFVIGLRMGSPIFLDFMPVIILPFVLAGISLIHGLMNAYSLPRMAYWIFYIVVIAASLFAQVLLLAIVVAAIIDSGFNFRARLGKSAA